MLEPKLTITHSVRALTRIALFIMTLLVLMMVFFRVYDSLVAFRNPAAAPGVYVDAKGYVIMLRKTMRYRLCDVKDCIEGDWHDSAAPRSTLQRLLQRAPQRRVTLDNVYNSALGQRLYSAVRERHMRGWQMPWRAPEAYVADRPQLVGQIENCLWFGNMPCLAYGHNGDSFRKAAAFTDPDPR
jgi:hypothetical protein